MKERHGVIMTKKVNNEILTTNLTQINNRVQVVNNESSRVQQTDLDRRKKVG